MRLPSLSIITPSFNHAAYIEHTIRSVLDQGYPALEYQVMDGGSTDGTVDILRRYEGRLRWVSEKDAGQGAAVNEGIRRTSGEIVGWINSDDLYAPGALAEVGRCFAEHPEVEWLFGRCPIVDREGRIQKGWITRYKEFWMRRYSYRRLLVENFINQPAVFFRRRLFERAGPVDPRYHCAMDYDLFIRMGALARPAFLDRELAYFRISGDNKTSNHFVRSFTEELDAAKRLTAGRHPVLMLLHEVNRVKLITAYHLLALARGRR
jgi:glycosyltransferase involved in cell wall biosynthesis